MMWNKNYLQIGIEAVISKFSLWKVLPTTVQLSIHQYTANYNRMVSHGIYLSYMVPLTIIKTITRCVYTM